jgi:hypothetical protein
VAAGHFMTWGTELVKLRRLLRDPQGLIWTESFLRHLWNDVQRDFQTKTRALEDVVAQRVPAIYQFAFQYDWEWRFLPDDLSKFYQCLSQHDDKVFCHRWEPQVITGLAADVADYGIHFTQPWEGCMGEVPGEVLKMKFPLNFGSMKFIAYDEVPLEATSRKAVQSANPSYITTEGTPFAYYPYDETEDGYVLYPRPGVNFVNELEGEGLALYAEGDDEDDTVGVIAVREGSSDLDSGAPMDVVDVTDSVFMVYEVSPPEVESLGDEPDFPGFLCKYLRYGVATRAYGANTDGRIRTLAEFWQIRYDLGIEFTRRWLRNRRQDRDYRLVTRGSPGRRSYRHPRLPDSYPATNP